MSSNALLLENNELRAQLAKRDAKLVDRDAELVDREAKIEQLSHDLQALVAHLNRLLAGRGGAHLIAEGQGVLFPSESAPEEEALEEETAGFKKVAA